MSVAGWLAAPIEGGSAVIPLDDEIVHDVHGSENCVCGPDLIPVIENGLIVGLVWDHRALDGRQE